ncbi:MAG: FGGY-family carbohydrate kinase, partial [Candidatus Didemnitutus sp.]|nr:FGGY-family carbohydrate kinase [Candidatus Didemnitutus sp.]
FGTSGTIYAHSNQPVIDPLGEIAAFCSSTGGWLPLVCTMNVTGVTEQFRTLAGLDHAAVDAAVAGVPSGAGGLVLLPYLDGERTPNLPHGKGVLFGLTRANGTPGHLMRAAMEGATLGMNHGLRRLTALGIKPQEIRLTGGGARSPQWRQIMADVFGLPVVKMKADEGAALGGAIQAVWCHAHQLGANLPLADLCAATVEMDESTRCQPDRRAQTVYREQQQQFDRLASSLRPFFN